MMSGRSTMRWSEPSLPSDCDNKTNNSNTNTNAATSGSSSTPTIKNHSVTYHQGLLYCFGGYDGRKNHQTLLIYSLKEHRWLTVASVPNGVNADTNNDGDDGGGVNPVHRNIHNPLNGSGSGSIQGNRRVAPSRYVVTGAAPPGRNGHTATLATCRSRRRRRRGERPLGGANANDPVAMNAPANNGSDYLQARQSLESKLLRQNSHSMQQRQEKGLEDALRETARLSISPPLSRHDLSLEYCNGERKPVAPVCAESDDSNRCGNQENSSNINDCNNNLQQNSEEAGNTYSNDNGNSPEAAESGFHRESEVDRVIDSEEEEFINDEEDAQIIIIGGWLGSGPLAASDMWVLDISGGLERLRWFQPPSRGTPPGPCNMHSADFLPSLHQVYVFRGGNGREYLNDLHALDVETYTWHPVQTTGCPPQQRANHSSAVLTWNGVEELFIFGGWNGSERLNDVHVLDTATGTWTTPRISGVKPHPRAGMTLTALRGRLYLFGGSGTSSKCFDDLQILDRKEMAWLDVNDGEEFRRDVAVSMSGGNDGNYTSLEDEDFFSGQDGMSYANGRNDGNRNVKFVDWRTQEGGHPSGLGGACRSVNPNDEDMVPSVFITGKPPGKRAGHTATAAGRHIFIFGGSCGSDYLSDSFVLDTDPPPLMNVTEPTCLQLYARRLRHFYDDEEFSDVTFIVENRKVRGHKLVLSCVSDCFRAMFMTGFRESTSGCTEIEIPNCRYDIFVIMMNYIYSGQLSDIDVFNSEPGQGMERVIALLELADQFFLYNLKQVCEKILQPAVNVDTYSFLLHVAQKTNSMQLESYCQYFERNIHEFLE